MYSQLVPRLADMVSLLITKSRSWSCFCKEMQADHASWVNPTGFFLSISQSSYTCLTSLRLLSAVELAAAHRLHVELFVLPLGKIREDASQFLSTRSNSPENMRLSQAFHFRKYFWVGLEKINDNYQQVSLLFVH